MAKQTKKLIANNKKHIMIILLKISMKPEYHLRELRLSHSEWEDAV